MKDKIKYIGKMIIFTQVLFSIVFVVMGLFMMPLLDWTAYWQISLMLHGVILFTIGIHPVVAWWFND